MGSQKRMRVGAYIDFCFCEIMSNFPFEGKGFWCVLYYVFFLSLYFLFDSV